MDKKTVEIFFKRNIPINPYELFDNALLIWNPKRKKIKDYNFDHALSYDCIKNLEVGKEYLTIHYDSASDANLNLLRLKLKRSLER